MTTIDRSAKRRARRIAADEAHAWARNLRLNNPNAKLVLSMLTLYVDGDGGCWVSVPTLAEDTELSANTVRNRLNWLQEAGAIVCVSQWIDEYGRRNGDGRGRRTSDLIRLLIDNRDDDIETKAVELELEAARRRRGAAKSDPPPHGGSTDEADPPPHGGSDEARDSSGTPLALQRPSNSVEGLISEPEPEHESSPSPSRGERELDSGEEEPEHFGPAWVQWPGHQLQRRDLALAEFRKLTPDQQLRCRAAVQPFNELRKEFKRDTVMNFHLWIRQRGFDEFKHAQPVASASAAAVVGPKSVDPNTDAGRAVVALYAVARTRPFEHRGVIVYPGELTPQVLLFAQAGSPSAWQWIEDRQQIAAWSEFLKERVFGIRPPIITTRGLGEAQRSGITAPWPWPPRKDGTLSPEETGDAA